MKQNPIGQCLYCGQPIRYMDARCAHCGRENGGWHETTQNQCGNCHARLQEGDKYCRICGTKAGEGAYEPYQDLMQCIYGPMPVERKHECRSCGYQWSTHLMLDKEEYCPKCGGGVRRIRGAMPDGWGFSVNGIWRRLSENHSGDWGLCRKTYDKDGCLIKYDPNTDWFGMHFDGYLSYELIRVPVKYFDEVERQQWEIANAVYSVMI